MGSVSANLATTAVRTPEGDYVLNGEKLWCTDGTIAELFVVMPKHPDTGKISALIVEKDWPGVEAVLRCQFMGLKAIENGVVRFTNVRVPKTFPIRSSDRQGLIFARSGHSGRPICQF